MKENLVWKNEGIRVFENQIEETNSGFKIEVFNEDEFKRFGIDFKIKNEMHIGITGGNIKGLYIEPKFSSAKIIRVTLGKSFIVTVDVRKNSKEFGKWYGYESKDEDNVMIYIDPGFAVGFKVLSNFSEIHCLSNQVNDKIVNSKEKILWNDKDINIIWPETKYFHTIEPEIDDNTFTLKKWSKKKENNIF